MYRKEIVYDRVTRDYACYIDGELVAFERTYREAEILIDQMVYDLLSAGAFASAAALDGGSDPDAMAADVVAGLVEPVAEADDDAPGDAPGDDCPDHGPYADDECPKCTTCNGEGRIPCNGYGDQAGGWADTCPDCEGKSLLQV